MRNVSVVKEQRNILREELGKCINKVKEMKVDEQSFKQMNQHDQQVYIYCRPDQSVSYPCGN